MTTKELSEFFDCSVRTIQMKAKELGISKKQGSSKDWSTEEISLLSEKFKNEKTNFVSSFSQNATVGTVAKNNNSNNLNKLPASANAEVETYILNKEIINQFTNALYLFSKTLESIDKRLLQIENNQPKQIEEKKQLSIIPEMSDRNNLNMIIRDYTAKYKTEYQMAWNILYKQAYYRLGINFSERANNEGLSKIEYAEQHNLIGQLLSLAIELFGDKNENCD